VEGECWENINVCEDISSAIEGCMSMSMLFHAGNQIEEEKSDGGLIFLLFVCKIKAQNRTETQKCNFSRKKIGNFSDGQAMNFLAV
jgi:hypothetical protein